MSLKQSIVVVNEYTVNGSRGATPGDYVTRYMARAGATEDVTPVLKNNTDEYITRYMARETAVDEAVDVPNLKVRMKNAQKRGGVAFGYGSVSLSEEDLVKASRDIQHCSENGKTVMKTVISFDEQYLRDNGIIDEDFEFKNKGDYRGHIDQMKLRMAIMQGVDRMSVDYDDLQFIGVIQVDTAHVHCHLAMVDRGEGNVMNDGTQKGKISQRSMGKLRRGIDTFLDDNHYIRYMSSNIGRDKRNVKGFVKKYMYNTMDRNGLPQFLIACLPEDRTLWRASSNAKSMKKANAIVREYVLQVMNEPNSGYKGAIRDIGRYADYRREREGLSEKDTKMLIHNGREQLIERCMNGVYDAIKTIPKEELKIRTPMMDMMSRDIEELVSSTDLREDPMVGFGFRLRSYATRKEHHTEKFKQYHDAVKNYDARVDNAPESIVVRDFLAFERDWNEKCMSKYQHFLSFVPPKKEYEDEFEEIMRTRRHIRNYENMKADKSIKGMTPKNAEEYCRKAYDEKDGSLLVTNPSRIDALIKQLKEYDEHLTETFTTHLSEQGMSLDGDYIQYAPKYPFLAVRSLDLHHLTYDFSYDFKIDYVCIKDFVEAANTRYELFTKARDYLESTGQGDMVNSFDVEDIEVMKKYADTFSGKPVYISKLGNGDPVKKSKTVPLDVDYNQTIQTAIEASIITTREEIGEQINYGKRNRYF